MQVIQSELFTVIVPDKGCKLVNKETGKEYKKIYLGKNDSVENYCEIVDEKYVDTEYAVELTNLKERVDETDNLNNDIIDTLLLTIKDMYDVIQPLLMMMPMTIKSEGQDNKFGKFYLLMVKRNLISIDDVPEKFKKYVDEYLS